MPDLWNSGYFFFLLIAHRQGMGLLSKGTPLPWEQAKQYADHVRRNGIEQFLHIYECNKSRSGDPFVWGDEVEYMLVSLDHVKKTARLSLRAASVLDELQREETLSLEEG